MIEVKSEDRPNRRPLARKKPDIFSEFRHWLTGLDMINPTLHVNGAAHPIAVLTVDFGTPLVEQKFTPEQNAELVSRMRAMTRLLCNDKEINVRVQNDTANGVWWASVG